MTFEPEQALRLQWLAGGSFKVDQWQGAALHHCRPLRGSKMRGRSSLPGCSVRSHAKAHAGVSQYPRIHRRAGISHVKCVTAQA